VLSAIDGPLEVLDVLIELHVADLQLVVLQDLEGLLLQVQHVQVLVFVGLQLEFRALPELDDDGQRLLHLHFLLGLVDDLGHAILVVEELEVPDHLESQVVVDEELLLDKLLQALPVAVVLRQHGGVLQVRQNREEGDPLLDLLEDALVDVAALVDLAELDHALAELLDFLLHLVRVDQAPGQLEVLVELLLAEVDQRPEPVKQRHLQLDLLDELR